MSVLALFITAIIWGTAFVAQSEGMDYLGPFSFNAIRYLIGSIVLIPLILVLRAGRRRKAADTGGSDLTRVSDGAWEPGTDLRHTVIGGLMVGLALCVASLFQQFGIIYTTVGKAGFITALYIIIVPFYGVLLKRKVGWKVWHTACS